MDVVVVIGEELPSGRAWIWIVAATSNLLSGFYQCGQLSIRSLFIGDRRPATRCGALLTSARRCARPVPVRLSAAAPSPLSFPSCPIGWTEQCDTSDDKQSWCE